MHEARPDRGAPSGDRGAAIDDDVVHLGDVLGVRRVHDRVRCHVGDEREARGGVGEIDAPITSAPCGSDDVPAECVGARSDPAAQVAGHSGDEQRAGLRAG
jgi:hypothetical protein